MSPIAVGQSTVIGHEAVRPPAVMAVMVAVPLKRPVTRPDASTVATDSSLLVHMMSGFVALPGLTVAMLLPRL